MLFLTNMDMLTKQDLKEIGKLIGDSQACLQTALEKKIEESSDKVIGAIGEMIRRVAKRPDSRIREEYR